MYGVAREEGGGQEVGIYELNGTFIRLRRRWRSEISTPIKGRAGGGLFMGQRDRRSLFSVTKRLPATVTAYINCSSGVFFSPPSAESG